MTDMRIDTDTSRAGFDPAPWIERVTDVQRAVINQMLWDETACRYSAEQLDRQDFDDPLDSVFAAIIAAFRRLGGGDWLALPRETLDVLLEAGDQEGCHALTDCLSPDDLSDPGRNRWLVGAMVRHRRDRKVKAAAAQMSANPDKAERIMAALAEDPALTRLPLSDVMGPTDLRPQLREAIEGRGTQPMPTGWTSVDALWQPVLGESTVLIGSGGGGKSTWVDALAVRMATKHGWRICFWSPEQWHYGAVQLPRLLQRVLGRPVFAGNAPRDDVATWPEIVRADDEMADSWRWINPTVARTIDEILLAADALYRRWEFQMLVLDPWTAVRRGPGEEEYDHISATYPWLANWAAARDAHVLTTVHTRKRRQGESGAPTPEHARGANHFADVSDNVLSWWRPDPEQNRSCLRVWKVRHQRTGRSGEAWLDWRPTSYDFADSSGRPTPRVDTPAALWHNEG